MRYYKHFLTLACLATLLFLPAQSFSLEENPVNVLEEVEPNLDQKLTGDVLAKTYYKNNRRNQAYKYQWKPYVAPLFLNTPSRFPYLQVNVGFGFLRFDGLKGGLTRAGVTSTAEKKRYEGRLAYSRTPVVEMILGYQYTSWFQFGFSYQHQGDIDIQTVPQMLAALSSSFILSGQFHSSLRLDAFAAKFYFNTPTALIMKGVSYSAYLGLGTGLSMQSWTNMTVDSMDFQGAFSSSSSFTLTDNFSLKNKYCANWFFMVDPGFKIKNVIPNRGFSVLLGCKFNYWGQARNLGDQRQMQDWVTGGLGHPLGVKAIYQFAPYIGFELDF